MGTVMKDEKTKHLRYTCRFMNITQGNFRGIKSSK